MVKYLTDINNKKTDTNRDDMNRYILEMSLLVKQYINDKMSYNTNKNEVEMMKGYLDKIMEIRWNVAKDMASYQISAPGRNYLLSYILEEKYDIESKHGDTSQLVLNIPIQYVIQAWAFHVDPLKARFALKKAKKSNIKGVIMIKDTNKLLTLNLKNIGVICLKYFDLNDKTNSDIKLNVLTTKADWVFYTKEKALKNILVNSRNKKRANIGKRGHNIPRIRSIPAAFAGVVQGIFKSDNAIKNGLIKGKDKAILFMKSLEIKTLSKL